MFQSTPVAGRNSLEEVTPRPNMMIPLKGEVSNQQGVLMALPFSMNAILRSAEDAITAVMG